MATDRVIQVPLGGKDPDTSGVGKMLFGQFEEARKNKTEAAQLDVTEGIRSKYRQQEAAQGNVFNEGLTKLRSFLNQQATDVTYQRAQEAQGQAATYLQGLVGQAAGQGVPMPGLTTETEGGAGVPAVNTIAPGALEVAKDAWGKNLDRHFKEQELRTGLKMDAERKIMFEQMDRVDDQTAMEARDMHARFTALDADPRLLATIEGFTKPGQGSKMAWKTEVPKMISEEMKLTAQAANKMALAREITARQQNIAKLKADSAKALLNTRMDATQYRNLASLHQALGNEAKGLMNRHAQLLEAIYAAPLEKQAGMNTQAAMLRAMAEDVQQQQAQVAQKMAGWQPLNPGTTPGQVGPTAPGFQGLPTPGRGGRDPMGIR